MEPQVSQSARVTLPAQGDGYVSGASERPVKKPRCSPDAQVIQTTAGQTVTQSPAKPQPHVRQFVRMGGNNALVFEMPRVKSMSKAKRAKNPFPLLFTPELTAKEPSDKVAYMRDIMNAYKCGSAAGRLEYYVERIGYGDNHLLDSEFILNLKLATDEHIYITTNFAVLGDSVVRRTYRVYTETKMRAKMRAKTGLPVGTLRGLSENMTLDAINGPLNRKVPPLPVGFDIQRMHFVPLSVYRTFRDIVKAHQTTTVRIPTSLDAEEVIALLSRAAAPAQSTTETMTGEQSSPEQRTPEHHTSEQPEDDEPCKLVIADEEDE